MEIVSTNEFNVYKRRKCNIIYYSFKVRVNTRTRNKLENKQI